MAFVGKCTKADIQGISSQCFLLCHLLLVPFLYPFKTSKKLLVLYKRSSKHQDNRVLIYIHNFSILYCIFMKTQNRWVKCLKNGPSKICGRQSSCLPKLFLYRCSECKEKCQKIPNYLKKYN